MKNTVNVLQTEAVVKIQESPTIVKAVETPSKVVKIVTAGPQGPKGDTGATGPKGDPSAFYIHSQAAPSTTWTMTHNLGFKPSVELLDTGSQEIEGDVVHTSQNVCIASFSLPIAGFARLN